MYNNTASIVELRNCTFERNRAIRKRKGTGAREARFSAALRGYG